MNLPPFEKDKEDWKPRNHIGRDDSLTPLEREILDTMDILEQRQDRTSKLAIATYNRQVVIGFAVLILLVLHGVEIIQIVRGWIGGGP